MNKVATIILPGLDGATVLLEHFKEQAPATHDVRIIALPDNPDDNYTTLCDYVSGQIKGLESCHIIAESFSGPLGILLAHRHPEIVVGLTLVSSFATSPRPIIARMIPWPIVLRIPLPSLIAKRLFAGGNRNIALQLRDSVRQTSCQTLIRRISCVMAVNVTAELSQLNCPVTYIRPTQDRLVSIRSVHTILKAKPSVVVREIQGPHLIMQTQSKRTWELIVD